MTGEQLDDLVDLWHNSPEDGVPLHEFLRMTWDEYGQWTRTGVVPVRLA